MNNPVLFYGSSITHGGCATRTGNNYAAMLCRAVDAPLINLGFSGSGCGEIAIARAVADLKLSAVVMDYDHNAPSVNHLARTHESFFRALREKQPELPVIIMSKCDFKGTKDEIKRREVIRKTYENAVKAGDKKVWFIDGETLFGSENRDACGCHPNDLGFYRIYRAVLPVLQLALKQQ
ncbi:MAG: SGNH/GDSL hydrolase family protein [Victivallaceae bacterium]